MRPAHHLTLTPTSTMSPALKQGALALLVYQASPNEPSKPHCQNPGVALRSFHRIYQLLSNITVRPKPCAFTSFVIGLSRYGFS